MKIRTQGCAIALAVAGLFFANSRSAAAQQTDHAVTTQELRQDVSSAADSRRANESVIREVFSTEQGQKALKTANVDYEKIDRAVSQLNDEDLARLAERSREVQKDFAAGAFSDRDLLLLVLVALAIILIIIAVR